MAQTYLMETKDGLLVWVPEDKLEAFEAAQSRADVRDGASTNSSTALPAAVSTSKAPNLSE